MLKYRLISTFVLVPIVITALFLLSPTQFAIVNLLVCMLAAWEWGQLSGFNSRLGQIWLLLLFSVLLLITIFLLSEYYNKIRYPIIMNLLWIILGWLFMSLFLVIFYPLSASFWKYSKVLRIFFGLITIIPFFCGMLILRTWHYNENHYSGALWLLYIMLLVWGGDSGAYIFGKLFGKHKLAPKVSSGKTWQGFVGGLITTILISWGYGTLVNMNLTIPIQIICSIIFSLTSVLGDLIESMFKREAGIKDSGRIIPGHGGILDLIDSLTITVPIFACLISLIFKNL